MARNVIIMTDTPDVVLGLKRVTCAFWIPVAANVAAPNPRASSAIQGSAAPSPAELDALKAGTVVERVCDFLVPDNWPAADVRDLLLDSYTRAVAAYKPDGAFYGANHDGVQWNARPA